MPVSDVAPIREVLGIALITEAHYARAIETLDAGIRTSASDGWSVAHTNLYRC